MRKLQEIRVRHLIHNENLSIGRDRCQREVVFSQIKADHRVFSVDIERLMINVLCHDMDLLLRI